MFARAPTSTGSIPTYEMVNIFLPSGQVIENLPFASVTVPTPVPVILIDAPITGCPSSSDRTVPETFVCAMTIPTHRNRHAKSVLILFSIKSLSFINYKIIISAANLYQINLISKKINDYFRFICEKISYACVIL